MQRKCTNEDCGHEADMVIQSMSPEPRLTPFGAPQIVLCGCCFVKFADAHQLVFIRVVIDIRTGMALPVQAARERAARLN